jgi:hypothetical protein
MTARHQLARTYPDARARFVNSVTDTGARTSTEPHPLTGPDGGPLAIDVAEWGPPDAAEVVLVVSGTHGIEGFCGSAMQSGWIDAHADLLRSGPPRAARLVMVHAFNPFGFAWSRRVNEDNIDLNRNFIDWDAPPPHNDGYDSLAELLVPPTWDDTTQERTSAELLAHAADLGIDGLQAAITSGQYRHPSGVFYGGDGPTWSNRWLTGWFLHQLEQCERLCILDLHSGLGPWGEGEYIVHHPSDHPGFARADARWPAARSSADGDSVSVLLSGDWLDHVESLVPDVEITSAALEFGTVDPISVLQALRSDAWLWAHGEPRGASGEAVRAQVRAAFADDDPAWLARLTEQFTEAMSGALLL